MRFDIKCSTFTRLASICNFFEPETTQEQRASINTLRLEAINGKIIAICTNQRIAAVEYIAQCDPNLREVIHVILSEELVSRCKLEAIMDGVLSINTIPEIANAMAQTSSGWMLTTNVCTWPDETVLDNWRKFAPDESFKKSEGIMVWNLLQVQALFESSPTGKVYFPRHIDANKPVVLRDMNNPFWVGLFIPSTYNHKVQKESAELPDWWW